MLKNWLLCCDLQTILQTDILLKDGKCYLGLLRRKLPSEGNIYGDQYEFEEVKVPLTVCNRNVHLFIGQYVTLTCRPNGSLRLNFKNLKIDTGFSVETYCLEVANEIRMALKGLIEN